jgi:sec-independent protein translocase protein TatA
VPNIGPTELIIVLVIVLLVFGPKRLPGLGRQLGSGMREFKDSITGKGSGDDDRDEPAAERPASDEDDARRQANAALGRPESEPQTVEGDVVSDRTVR